MQQDIKEPLAACGTMMMYDPAAMEVRNALRMLLRAYEKMYGLPPSFQTVAERQGELKKTGHHNRD